MNFPDDIAADLPAPRDNEPESLRQDIVDELADHLQCALHRELLAGGTQQASGRRQPADFPNANEHTAWQHVLTRFGNPATIARRLWFDAMKERLMAQRITATMATLAAGACIVMAVLVWKSTLRDHDAQRQLLAQQQQLNQTLLAELQSLRQSSSTAATNAGWAPVKVRLQSEAGEPVAGQVTILGTAINAGNDNEINVSRTANEAGVADFGLLPFGNYELQVAATAVKEEHRRSFMLSPNTPAEQTIICPIEPPPAVDAKFEIEPPPPLHADQLVFLAIFSRSSRNTLSGAWNLSSHSDRGYSVLFDTEGTILGEMVDPTIVSARSDGFTWPGGNGRDVEVIQFRLAPARTIRSTDRCIGLSVGARVDDDSGDPLSLRLAQAPTVHSAESLPSGAFVDEDPADETVWIRFSPPPTFWEQIVAAFRQTEETAAVTTPEGWQIVKVPADLRLVLTAANRSRPGRSSSASQPPPNLLRLQVVTTLEAQQLTLPVGVGEGIVKRQMGFTREALEGARKIDVNMLVSPELAEAIELARSQGTLEAVRLSGEDAADVDENGVNQQTLETLRKLAAEQSAAKDE